jgi:hypothetical protein
MYSLPRCHLAEPFIVYRSCRAGCLLFIVWFCLTGLCDRSLAVPIAPTLCECTPDDPHAGKGQPSADYSWMDQVDEAPTPPADAPVSPAAVGPIVPATGQPVGALSERIIFLSAGHGWTAGSSSWSLQRPVLLEMNEDYGNLDQMNVFAAYCFNAGATVVPFRPIGNQINEVVLDNDDPGVTFAGTWSNSSAPLYYGSPGDVAYRFAALAATQTATATYVPNLPAAGLYPVYTWVAHGANRTFQLYRVRHTGGESHVRIPHHMVGNGWVYLGSYHFAAGSNPLNGAVLISNLQPTPSVGSVVIADAIRFGNGMGVFDRGFGKSTYPSEEESARYWVQRGLGQGQSPTLYDPDYPGASTDDGDDNVGTPPRMAREMNATGVISSIYKRLLISFHSNAGGGRGVVGLWNDNALFANTGTPNQFRLAQLLGAEINNDLSTFGVPPLEVAWNNRGGNVTFRRTDFAFGEIRNDTLGGEMDATIVEVAFHDNDSDARLLRDPKVRNWVARATYQGVVRYMNEFDGAPLTFLPEPPQNPRAIASGSNVVVSWSAPIAQSGSGSATGYVVCQSTNGYGFGSPIGVSGATLSLTFSNLAADTTYYFRIAATNAGGESFPTETVACRFAANPGTPKVLIVNAFDRFERFTNLRQTPATRNYKPPGHDANGGTMDRVLPARNNAFDYAVTHATALAASGYPFDSCQNEAIINNQVALANYPIVIWACGNESTTDRTFNSTEQSRVATFLAAGGSLFVSGSDIAYDLDRPSGPTTADRNFLRNQLRVAYANDNSASYTASPVSGSIFAGRASATVDNGSGGSYWVPTPDVLLPNGAGTRAALNYSGGTGAAAIQYDGSSGGGRVVCFGFPFETITSATRRNEYMANILTFLGTPAATNVPPSILTPPQSVNVVIGSNATLTVVAAGTAPLSYQWCFNGADLAGATASSFSRNNAQPVHSGHYQVVVSNAFGTITSQVATLVVTLPPAIEVLFADNFDVNTAANWVTNRSTTDTRVTFNYNHAADGIPSAPHATGGTTRGVKFEANLTSGAAAAINVSPVGQNFAGDYRLRFDAWLNANGPFPLGGNGSTEHLTAGLGTTGNRVQWTAAGSTADGHWFAVDGEGQASDTLTTALNDFGAFSGTTYHSADSGVYAAGTASNSRGNGNTYYHGALPGGQTAPALQQGNHPQQTGALAAGTSGFAWRDVIISKTANTVEWFLDGLKIATINNATFTANNFFIGYWDSFNSLSDNAALSFGLVDNVRVERFVTNVPPYITSQPQGLAAREGTNVTFAVLAGGTGPLTYQWRFNGTNLPSATASSLTRNNVQPADAGDYSVLITNVAGMVVSSTALLTVTVPQPLKFESVTLLANDELKLLISSEPGTLTIQWSSNLVFWETLTNLAHPGGTIEVTDPVTVATPQRFYRALMP